MYILQEVHSTPEVEKVWSNEWGSPIFFSHGTSKSAGVALLMPRVRNVQIRDIITDPNGRFIVVNIDLFDRQFILCGLYGPNVDAPDFYETIMAAIDHLQNPDIMIVGDFNLVLDDNLDRKPVAHYNVKATKMLLKVMKQRDLVDIWRVKNPDTKIFSWNRNNSCSRIDMLLVNNSMINNCKDIYYEASTLSDHMTLCADFKLHQNPRGKGYWKFNSLLLNDSVFVQAIMDLITDVKEKFSSATADVVWERFKTGAADIAQKRGIAIAKERKEYISDLRSSLTELKIKSMLDPNNRSLTFSIQQIETKINEYFDCQVRAAAFRSKAKWIREGEKNSKYFFALEKSNYNKKVITQLYDEQGAICNHQSKNLEIQRNFYENLYSIDPTVNFTLKNESGVQVMEQDRDFLEGPISMGEYNDAVQQIKKAKTPGNDGLTIEFYQYFWYEIRDMLTAAYDVAMNNGFLHDSATKGVIAVIPKKSKDPLYIANWRPLTMLNIDYKIWATVLANRMKIVLPYLISEDQTGFMAGRQISATIRKVNDLVSLGNALNEPGLVLNTDFQKCFDLISYSGIRGALKFFCFGEKFVNMVDLLLNNFQSCMTNNGYFSQYFDVSRSCHQGCPLAPSLMILCAETMAIMLKRNENIEPYCVLTLKQNLSQYADDTQVLSKNTKKSIDNIVQTFEVMEKNVGFRVNYDKTVIHMFGGAEKIECDKPFRWTNNPPDMLGINYNRNQYEELLVKSDQVLTCWLNRRSTLMGKILVINTLIASLYVYIFQSTPSPPQEFYVRFKELIHKYLWGLYNGNL